MNVKMTYGESMPLVYTRDSKPRQKAEFNDKLDRLIAKLEQLTSAVRKSNTPVSVAVQTADASRLFEQRCAEQQAAYDARNPHKK